MYCYTHETISYRQELVTLQAGVGEDNSHNSYLTTNSSSMETPIWVGFHNCEPGLFTDADLDDVHKAPSRSRLGRSLTSQAMPQTYQNTKLLRLHEQRRGELVG